MLTTYTLAIVTATILTIILPSLLRAYHPNVLSMAAISPKIHFKSAATSPPFQAAQVMLDKLNDLSPISSATSILDVAAGTGTVFSLIFESDIDLPPSTKLIAQDINDSALQQIRDRKDDPTWSRVETVQGNAADLKRIADASQSHVVSQMGIFLVPEYRQALSEVMRVLRPGGSFAMTSVAHASWNQQVLGQITGIFPERRIPSVDDRWTHSTSFQKTLEEAGFSDVQISETPISIGFTDRRALVDGLYSMPYLKDVTGGLTESEMERCKEAMLDVIERDYSELPGKLPGKALVATGCK